MLDALFFIFNVAVEHRGVGAQADFMRGARDFQPLPAGGFVVANHSAHARIENFRASAGKRIHSRFFQRDKNFAHGELGDARKISDLDHRERFQMHGRAALLQPANHFQKIFKRQIRMQSADHVKFRGAGANAFFGPLVDFIEREIVCAGRVRVASKRAQFAMRHANVRGIDVPVHVEIADVAMARFADVVREPANGQEDRANDTEGCRQPRISRSPARTLSAMGRSRASVI